MKYPKFDLYKAKDGFRWRLMAANGKVIAESGEAYAKKPNWEKLLDKIEKAAASCTVQLP